MRTHIPKLMVYGVAGGIAAYMFSRRRRQAVAAAPSVNELLAPDPADPVQSMDALDQVDLDDLDVDALSMAEGTGQYERASLESAYEEPEASEVGDLYAVPEPRGEDRLYPDDDQAMNEGQNWIEALETSAAENGPLPGQSVASLVDDEDGFGARHASDSEDTPVADRGSGGPAGI